MRKKKYLIGLALVALSMTTLVACGDEVKPTPEPEPEQETPGNGGCREELFDEEITINVADKEYDGKTAEVTATAKSGKQVKLEFKHKGDDDKYYSTSLSPTEVGEYEVRASVEESSESVNCVRTTYPATETTASFKITYSSILNYTSYENTSSYVKVNNEKEFLDALYNARFSYSTSYNQITHNDGYVVRNNVRKNATNWANAITKGLYLKNDDDTYTKIPADTPFDANDTNYTASMTYYEDSPKTEVNSFQSLETEGQIRVIEIASDLDLGYNRIKDLNASPVYENWDKSNRLAGKTDVYCDSYIQEAGISKINVSNLTNVLIYSKNGAKLTHCGFSVSSCKNVTFRNIEMDEIWMWEDSTSTSPTIKVGDYDSFGWAYFKVSLSEDITIDHCTFGKSFDGQIDYSQPFYQSIGTYQKSPFAGSGDNGLTVSFCEFNAGSDDPNGYLYKMMDTIEKEYQLYAADKASYTYSNKSCRYYFTLRENGLTFDDILYGIAVPQKKGFLWGDENEYYLYNKHLTASLIGCKIKNIEDRIPKVRGGIAYVYNTEVDNTEYLPYVTKLKNVQSAVQGANSKYKLGAVSQGILAGLDASVYLEGVVYKGINSYLKNNETISSSDMEKWGIPTINGGYKIVNSIIGNVSGSTGTSNAFASLVSGSLSTSDFSFKLNGEKVAENPNPYNCYNPLRTGSLDEFFSENPAGIITTDYNWLTL